MYKVRIETNTLLDVIRKRKKLQGKATCNLYNLKKGN